MADGQSFHWIPLESNPDMLTAFARRIGLESSDAVFSDCVSIDPELLFMVPRPCRALIFLFPCTNMYKAQGERPSALPVSDKVYFMKQLVSNACGSIAVIHALINSRQHLAIKEDSFLWKFFTASEAMSPEERGRHLGVAGNELKQVSEAVATDVTLSQTAAPAATDTVEAHFICFVPVDGHLYEFDGIRPAPINHGEVTDDDFVEKAAQVIRDQFFSHADELPAKEQNALSVILFGAASPEDE